MPTGTYEEIANLIRTRFRDTVAASNPTMIVTYDNAPVQTRSRAMTALVTVKIDSDQSIYLGSRDQFRIRGRLVVITTIPIELGDKQLWSIADQIKTAFRRTSVPPIIFQDATTKPLGRAGDRWRHRTDIVFRADGSVA